MDRCADRKQVGVRPEPIARRQLGTGQPFEQLGGGLHGVGADFARTRNPDGERNGSDVAKRLEAFQCLSF
ncbi:hypothetical protein D3C83_151200 [compost metagenome]